jgi:predicted NUDIX family NTP pyrophosphohydrolase
MYRVRGGQLQVFLAHPGGPFFQNKDEGFWTIPKGEPDPGEDFLDAAVREFTEETSLKPTEPYLELTPVKQKGDKTVHAWAFEGASLPVTFISNTFVMEWPPKSGTMMEILEIDKAEFFDWETAKRKINPAQAAFIDELEHLLTRTSE